MAEARNQQPYMEEAWYTTLVEHVERDGVKPVAERLGYSPGAVTGAVRGYYGAKIDAFAQRVIERLTSASVECPVLGEIRLELCVYHRERPFGATNPQRVQLWKACQVCPNNPNRTS
ncbi:MAG: XRE family transcriptional regulator [Bacteroidota bacterium]